MKTLATELGPSKQGTRLLRQFLFFLLQRLPMQLKILYANDGT
jgi:hypothetical protein